MLIIGYFRFNDRQLHLKAQITSCFVTTDITKISKNCKDEDINTILAYLFLDYTRLEKKERIVSAIDTHKFNYLFRTTITIMITTTNPPAIRMIGRY